MKNVGTRLLSLCWSALLIALMATGTLSSAHIGAMTFGPQHDIWSAAIAISQIRFGLRGELAYKEVEQAIDNEVTSNKNAWSVNNQATLILDGNPANVTRGFKAAAALAKKNLVIPTTKDGYVSDWAEDLGYADYYNLAFRLFGFSAYSTHYLYFSLLVAACAFFVLAFFEDAIAIGSLTLSVTAFFLLSSSSFFSAGAPSFAANRFLSTLAIVPLLHLVTAMLRRTPLTRFTFALLVVQSLVLSFAIAARESATWCLIAVTGVAIAVLLFRRLRAPEQPLRRLGSMVRLTAMFSHPAIITGAVLAIVFMGYSVVRNARIDGRYYQEDNFPHHLTWHSAYLGLMQNPDWEAERPKFPDVPAVGDQAGFALFAHVMTAWGLPYLSTTAEVYHQSYYRARTYETFIRRRYLTFLLRHPLYAIELFLYYKPMALSGIIARQAGNIPKVSWLIGACSLALASLCFACGSTVIDHFESIVCFFFVWLASLTPIIWAYAGLNTMADQFWSSTFLLLMLVACPAATRLGTQRPSRQEN